MAKLTAGATFHALISNNKTATLVYQGPKEYIISKGSYIEDYKNQDLNADVLKARKPYMGILNTRGRLTEDAAFESAFAAACFVTGKRQTGYDVFIDAKGKSLRDYM